MNHTFQITTGDPPKTFTVKFEGQLSIGSVTFPPPVDPPTPPVPPTPPQTEGFKVGVNSFPWFPLQKLAEINMKWVRCYVASGWIWQPGGLAVQPMHQAETAETHGIDDYLTRAKGLGISPLLCIHQTPEWFRNTGRGDGNNDYAPVNKGAKRDDPLSFTEYAAFLFQVAARYGRKKHPTNILRVDTKPRWNGDVLNDKKSGLDLLTYIEPWNEEKWWEKGTTEGEAYIEPETMAALMSACYDGHEGKLGAGVGIKTADPSMIVIMPGLSDFALDYVSSMDKWFKANRNDANWPCDILNFHHYSNTGNKLREYPAKWVDSGACRPVDDKNFATVRDLVDMSAAMGKKLWVTEFGADKVAPSMMLAKGIGQTNEQFQAEIIMQSIRGYKNAGVDGVFIFNAPDENSGADGGQFETCGIFSSEATGYQPTVASEVLRAYFGANKAVSLPFQKAADFKQK